MPPASEPLGETVSRCRGASTPKVATGGAQAVAPRPPFAGRFALAVLRELRVGHNPIRITDPINREIQRNWGCPAD
jgi:hypothetical protein